MCKQVVSGKLAMQLGRENRKNGKGGEQKQQKQKAESLSFNNMQWLRGNSCMELFPATHTHSHVPRAPIPYLTLSFTRTIIFLEDSSRDLANTRVQLTWAPPAMDFYIYFLVSFGLWGDRWSHVNWALLWLWLNFLEN